MGCEDPAYQVMHPLECAAAGIGSKITGTAAGAAQTAVTELAQGMSAAVNKLTHALFTWWMDPKLDPTVATVDGNGSWAPLGALSRLFDASKPLVSLFLFVSFVAAGVSVAVQHRAAPLLKLGQSIITLLVVTSLAAIAVQILVGFGDLFAKQVMSLQGSAGGTAGDDGAMVLQATNDFHGAVTALVVQRTHTSNSWTM